MGLIFEPADNRTGSGYCSSCRRPAPGLARRCQFRHLPLVTRVVVFYLGKRYFLTRFMRCRENQEKISVVGVGSCLPCSPIHFRVPFISFLSSTSVSRKSEKE